MKLAKITVFFQFLSRCQWCIDCAKHIVNRKVVTIRYYKREVGLSKLIAGRTSQLNFNFFSKIWWNSSKGLCPKSRFSCTDTSFWIWPKIEIFLGLFWSFLTRQNLFKRLLEFTQNWLCLSNDTKDTIVWWALKDVHDRVVYIGEI